MIYDQHNHVDECSKSYPGWRPIIDSLIFQFNVMDVDIEVKEVKESFGGLRFMFDTPFDPPEGVQMAITDLVIFAEVHTRMVCCFCSAPMTRRGSGERVRYFCDKHDTSDLETYWKSNRR